MREMENQKLMMEKDFHYKIDTKNEIIDEKKARIKEL